VPELPEVEVVRLGLEPAIAGATVTSAEVFDARSLRRHDGPSEDFVARITGAVLGAPRRRGKFLWIPILEAPIRGIAVEPTESLAIHLGMSGQVLLRTPDAPRDRLTRVLLDVRHPEHGAMRVDFVDQRIFGSMTIEPLVPALDAPGQTVPRHAAHIARDPLDPLFDDARFFAALARKKTAIKRALLDQTLISGVGNIYADEALWMSRIHPEQPTATLSRRKAAELLAAVREVFAEALAEGGTSFDAQYLNVNGESGYFSRRLKAYGRQGEPCLRCGRPIVRESFMNRGSHFCRHCQKLRYGRSRVSFQAPS
jgi:formamidopyrimidine-DNA glycosylase